MSDEPTAPEVVEPQEQPPAAAPQPVPPPHSCCVGGKGASCKTSWPGIIFLAVVTAIILLILWAIAP